MDYSLILANISKHISLTQEEVTLFTSFLRHKTLASGEYLLREGEVCKYESFVMKGCVKTYYIDDDGADHIIDFCIEQWWADDLYSLLTQTPATSNIRAIEETEILQISKNDLETLYRKIPVFERFFRILFQNAYIAQRAQINQAIATSAEERYQLFIRQKPYAEQRFSQKDIASYLGITPQFLSVMKKKIARVNVD